MKIRGEIEELEEEVENQREKAYQKERSRGGDAGSEGLKV